MSSKKILNILALGLINLTCFANDGLSNVSQFKEILDKSYDLINLDNVRQNSPEIDGDGIVVGILDTAINTNHPSFEGKHLGTEGVLFQNSWNGKSKGNHGTHVAGIILGKKINDNEPYGVAHNAKFYNLGAIEEKRYNDIGGNNINNAFKDKGIKVINHSWGKGLYPLIDMQLKGNRYRDLLPDIKSQYPRYWGHKDKIDHDIVNWLAGKDTQNLIALSKDDKILNVFAAGNSGIISSSIDSIVPSYDEDIRAWLNVGNLNALNAEKKCRWKYNFKK